MAAIYLVVLRIENEKKPRRLLFNSRAEAVDELAWWEDNERCEFATLAMVRYVDDFLAFATAGHKKGVEAIFKDPAKETFTPADFDLQKTKSSRSLPDTYARYTAATESTSN
jgi:hypothetical protein